MTQSPDQEPFDDGRPSKTRLKQEMHELQELGEHLTKLKPDVRAKLPLSESLQVALRDYGRMPHREARRRHLQYIGKLIRDENAEQLQQALAGFVPGSAEHTRRQHLAERWRDQLLGDDAKQQLTAFLDHYPDADVQHLRNLIRNALKAVTAPSPDPVPSRKLYQYLRELIDQQSNADIL